jgi:hypothetical protein
MARASLLQIDFRVDPERHALFLSRVAIFEAPPLAAARRDLEIQAVAAEHPLGFGGGLGVSRKLSVSGAWGQLPHGFAPLPPRLPPGCPRLPPEVNGMLRRSRDPKSIKKPAFYAGLAEVLGSLRISSDDSNGGAGGNRTPVHKSYVPRSTYVAASIVLTAR